MPFGRGFFHFGLRIEEGIEHGAWGIEKEFFGSAFYPMLSALCSMPFFLTPETSKFRA
jgi:hypothetical protein